MARLHLVPSAPTDVAEPAEPAGRTARPHLPPRWWLGPEDRALRARALEVALARGVPVDPDTLTVVLAARAACDELTPGVWTEAVVRQLLWLEVAGFCAEADLDPPDDTATALWAVIEAVVEGASAGADAERDVLLRPLRDSGGFRPPRRRPQLVG